MSSDAEVPVFFRCSSQDWLTICYLIDKRKKTLEKKFSTPTADGAEKKRSGRPYLPIPVLELVEVEGGSEDNVCFFSCSAIHFVALESLIRAHRNVLASREKARKGGRKIIGHKHPVPEIHRIEAQIV